MKCTDNSSKSIKSKNKRKRQIRNRWVACLSVILMIQCILAAGIYIKNNNKTEFLVQEYETSNYVKTLYKGQLFAENLCTASEDIPLTLNHTSEDSISSTDKTNSSNNMSSDSNVSSVDNALGFDPQSVHAVGLFDVNNAETDCAYNIHKKIYPASTTKILTALVALENGNLSDTVTVTDEADSGKFAADEQTCGIKAGDQLTLEDLLNGLLLYSGNDNAVAIADYIAGSTEKFAEMMNAEADKLMATNSHFVNPSGLHDDNHYTTAYDLYLIFNECIKHEEFKKIINSSSYTAHITGADGTKRDIKWEPTNYYAKGEATPPDNVTIIGGKTGTTKDAGNCLILLTDSSSGNPYISIIMGAGSKPLLYQDMTSMLSKIQ